MENGWRAVCEGKDAVANVDSAICVQHTGNSRSSWLVCWLVGWYCCHPRCTNRAPSSSLVRLGLEVILEQPLDAAFAALRGTIVNRAIRIQRASLGSNEEW